MGCQEGMIDQISQTRLSSNWIFDQRLSYPVNRPASIGCLIEVPVRNGEAAPSRLDIFEDSVGSRAQRYKNDKTIRDTQIPVDVDCIRIGRMVLSSKKKKTSGHGTAYTNLTLKQRVKVLGLNMFEIESWVGQDVIRAHFRECILMNHLDRTQDVVKVNYDSHWERDHLSI